MEHTNFEIQDGILKMYHGINKHVIIPEGVMEIGDEAFEDNQFIQVLEIPSTLVKILDSQKFMLPYLQTPLHALIV